MLHIAIYDHSIQSSSKLESCLKRIEEMFDEKMEIDIFCSSTEFYQYFKSKYYDAVYLEIELNNEDGITVGKTIRDQLGNDKIQIIYMSSSEPYATRVIKTRPMDLLMKPLTFVQILESIQTVKRLNKQQDDYFEFKAGYTSYKIPFHEILYFENSSRKIKILTKNFTSCFYGSMDSVQEATRFYNFIQIHKSYLVNSDYIQKYEYHQVTLSNGEVLPISQPNRKRIRMQRLHFE
ncbi:MAG: two-component response regulator [Herbinix sp.]|jgi:DNA-binding LytR/AlgR family response regulator|nr:two-component response regulator [Herbinix sp.]